MVVAVWSVKGGVGVTSVAALLAIGQAERAEETLLIDLCGDVPILLGSEDQVEPGIADWMATANPTAESLARIEVVVRRALSYVPRGEGDLGDLMSQLSKLDSRQVIVDCGVVNDPESAAGRIVQQAEQSLLVVRECYLTLRQVQRCELVPTGVVIIKEKDRLLGRADVEIAAGAPVVAQVSVDKAIAAALDSGLVAARLPRQLVRCMGRALDHVA